MTSALAYSDAMTTDDVTTLIAEYLTASRSRKTALVGTLAQTPSAAFDAILAFRGPYPTSIDPRDAHDQLVELMVELLKRCPRLFIECDLRKVDRIQRHPLLYAAIATCEPRFTSKIIGALRDRSIYIKLLVADAIVRHDYLRTPEAKRQLQRLLTVKSIAESNHDRVRLERALEAFRE